MKKINVKILSLLALGIVLVGCNNDDKLDGTSYLPSGDMELQNETDDYLYKTFTKPYNISVHYKWDRNIYGSTKDNNRNLYPPRLENVRPAFEMVDAVWIKSYTKIAGEEFVRELRPLSLLAAGSYAYNEDQTRTLGLASGGVQITLYEVDFLEEDLESAEQFIHTIQHEYIHIINQKQEFNQPTFGQLNPGDYTPNWSELNATLREPKQQGSSERKYKQQNGEDWGIDEYANILGFVTGYARANIIEDFAETASFYLSKKPEEIEAMLNQIRAYDAMTQLERDKYGLTADIYSAGGADKILYKYNQVKDYFAKFFNIDFDVLCAEAVKNAANSPMLNRNSGNTVGGIVGKHQATFGKKKYRTLLGDKEIVKYCQLHADAKLQLK